MEKNNNKSNKEFFNFLKEFKFQIFIIVAISIGLNLLTLVIPKVTAKAINDASHELILNQITFFDGKVRLFDQNEIIVLYGGLVVVIFILGLLQNILGTITSEKIAAKLRQNIIDKLSLQSFSYVQSTTSAKLLTNLTSDVDAVKMFISQGILVVFSSAVLLVGSAVSLLTINWQLAIPVLLTVPILLFSFAMIFGKISVYFQKSQMIVDKLNRVINESVVGSALIRVLGSRTLENSKFEEVNAESKDIGIKIVNGFATLIPMISLVVNLAMLVILVWGGQQIMTGDLNVGDFAAFFTYLGTFVLPIILLGFLGTTFTRAFASFSRIQEITEAEIQDLRGDLVKNIEGNIVFKNVSLDYGNTRVLDNISFDIKPGTKTAIIGPTAGGKSQIFYLMAGLLRPTEGEITIDGNIVTDYKLENLYSQLGLVFQDSVIYNTTLRENISFSKLAEDTDLDKALSTAALADFVKGLEDGLDTRVSERGSSLSGGQKQRLTLARALSINPKIILLDDFTARVDVNTEKIIFENLDKNYPGITLISITQKIDSIKDYDQIILVMEGELIAMGKHEELLENVFEYKQIYNSQQQIN